MNTETPYTPGPYYIRREQRARDTLVEIRGSTDISPMGPLVAVVKSALKRTEADAALLSAAPDMAQALLSFLSDHGHTPDCNYSGYSDHACSAECAAARAALRKATVLP